MRWLESVYQDEQLSHRAKAVYFYLRDRAAPPGDLLAGTGYHCPGALPLPLHCKTGGTGPQGSWISGNSAAVAAKRRKEQLAVPPAEIKKGHARGEVRPDVDHGMGHRGPRRGTAQWNRNIGRGEKNCFFPVQNVGFVLFRFYIGLSHATST